MGNIEKMENKISKTGVAFSVFEIAVNLFFSCLFIKYCISMPDEITYIVAMAICLFLLLLSVFLLVCNIKNRKNILYYIAVFPVGCGMLIELFLLALILLFRTGIFVLPAMD